MSKKFGIKELAKALGIEPASVRVRLRNEKIKKTGKSYEWDKGPFDKIVSQLKTKKAPGKKPTKKAAKKPATKKAKEDQTEGHKEAA